MITFREEKLRWDLQLGLDLVTFQVLAEKVVMDNIEDIFLRNGSKSYYFDIWSRDTSPDFIKLNIAIAVVWLLLLAAIFVAIFVLTWRHVKAKNRSRLQLAEESKIEHRETNAAFLHLVELDSIWTDQARFI